MTGENGNKIVEMDLAEVERRLAGDMTPEELRSLQKLYWPLAYSSPRPMSELLAPKKNPETAIREFREKHPRLLDFYKKLTENRDG